MTRAFRILALCLFPAACGIAVAQTTGQNTGQGTPQPPAFMPGGPAGNPNFQAAQQGAIPLTPGMIQGLAHRYDETSRALSSARISPFAAPQSRTVTVSWGPGSVTSIVQTAQGYPTAISFIDDTGQPWPIKWTANSNPAPGTGGGDTCTGKLTGTTGGGGNGSAPAVIATGYVACVPYKGSNVLELTPTSPYPRGGLLVNLEGAPAPLTFLLMASRKVYDASIDARVDHPGPGARIRMSRRSNAPETGAPTLTAMLDGTPPADAVPLAVIGGNPDAIRAWRFQRRLFVRTRDHILSPEWMTSEQGVGGVGIYELPQTPVVLMSHAGKTFSISFKDD